MCDDPAGRLRRLRWQCRRGMLELDLLLRGFVDQGYAQLDAEGQATFERLLRLPDPVIHDWLMGRGEPTDPLLASLIAQILETATGPPSRI